MADGRLTLVALIIAACAACEPATQPVALRPPRLPEGNAGKVLQRAIDAAGGWQRWSAARDVAFVATFTTYDQIGNVDSETIGLYKSPLHETPRVRFESLGIPISVVYGFDGHDTWMMRDGRTVSEPGEVAFWRFNMVSNFFWFSLPFGLAEIPVTIADMGEQTEGAKRWQCLRATLEPGAPEAPGDWLVIYFDSQTGLIDHVLVHATAAFLSHSMWVGKWLDYQDWNGIKRERRRQFFPADADGTILGNLVAEQLIEDIRFNNEFPAGLFEKPLAARGGSRT